MTSLIRKCVCQGTKDRSGQKRGKVLSHFLVNARHIKGFRIYQHNLIGILLAEVISSLIERSRCADTFDNDERNIKISHLKRTMEIFAGMDGVGMNPLHFHKQTDCEGVCLAVAGTTAHGIDQLLSLILASPLLNGIRVLLFGFLDRIVQIRHRSDALLIFLTWADCI